MSDKKRIYSSKIVDGNEQAPSRAMLRAVGFKDEDFKKPQIGIASTWSNVTPCNMHINQLADGACLGVDKSGSKGLIFNTITGFIIENSSKDGYFSSKGKNNERNRFPLSEIHFFPYVPLPFVCVSE